MPHVLNIADCLTEQARRTPDKVAIVTAESGGRTAVTFRELDDASDRIAAHLRDLGVSRGARALLMVRPGPEFTAWTFGLFKAGACPVLIDPGMGWPAFMRCMRHSQPRAFLGVPAAHLLSRFFPQAFETVRVRINVGRVPVPGALSGRLLLADRPAESKPASETDSDAPAAILFTSGSTGPARGVVYTHAIFRRQLEMLREMYGAGPAHTDLPCFPLFGLFSTGLGMTAVIPRMDPSRPARVDPRRIVRAVRKHRTTFAFGSPALWERVARYCRSTGVRLDSLRCVLMAGTAVHPRLHRIMYEYVLADDADVHTPYGATEVLPVSSITGREVLALADAAAGGEDRPGICVGRPAPGVVVRVIRILDEPIPEWDEALVLPPGKIGEIVVRSATVTPAYFDDPDATRMAKIRDSRGLWHRMGDVGWIDDHGRIWYCGRKSHRVRTPQGALFTVPCEAVFNRHPKVFRSALVGVGPPGRQTPAVVIQPEPGAWPRSRRRRAEFARELRELAQSNPDAARIQHVLFHRHFPVDVRHNAKIRRDVLAHWAEGKLRKKDGASDNVAEA